MDKCIACGLCAQKCPKKVDDPYNVGISKRKAIYLQYSQTVPLKYAIDDNCLYFTKGKCQACVKFCPTGAINFDDKVETRALQVGSIILAPGYQAFDPSALSTFGYGRIPDVVTGLEYERLLSAGGPFMGHLVRPSDHKEPRKVAWIQCVGSRNTTGNGHSYCSTVCCMYAVKQCLVTAEHLGGDDHSQTIFYMDLRSHNKEFERYYQDAKAKGTRFIKSQAAHHRTRPQKYRRQADLCHRGRRQGGRRLRHAGAVGGPGGPQRRPGPGREVRHHPGPP